MFGDTAPATIPQGPTPRDGSSPVSAGEPGAGSDEVVALDEVGSVATKAPAKAAKKTAAKKTAAKKAAKPKPRTGSLLRTMDIATVTLDDALKLLSLPRVVGKDPESGEEITAQNGRYGPYLKKGTDSRSLETEQQLFDITLDEALAIYAQPKQRGRGAAKPPLKELGEDPVSGRAVVVKDGRFGAYVTDGETNATLRKDDDIETLTPERGFELLAEKRAKGPTTRKRAAKKAPAKKAAKKAPAKKAAAKSTTAKKAAPRAE